MTPLEALVEKHKITVEVWPTPSLMTWERAMEFPGGTAWSVSFKREGPSTTDNFLSKKLYDVEFFTGSAIETLPSAADVLSCLCSDARARDMTFKEFCQEFGYDEDSRCAERTWSKCKALAEKLRWFLGDEFEEFCNAEH